MKQTPLDPKEQKRQAQITILRMLAASPKSPQSLKRRLEERGFDAAVVEGALAHMEEQGLVSDRAFGQYLLTKLTQSQPSGRKRIAFEMKHKGVGKKILEELVETISPEEERARARELAEARWQRLSNLDKEKRKKRVYDLLIRRGFSFDLCRELLQELSAA